MKALFRVAVTVLVLSGVSPLVNAQMMFHTPDLRGVWNPVVGSGASYEMTRADGEKSQMDIFIVGKETVEGKDGYWIETVIQNPKRGGDMVVKSLMGIEGTNGTVYRMVMQMAGRPPMEMSGQMLASRDPKKSLDIRSQGQDMGLETLTTPAGTFACEHWRSNDGADGWISPKAPPYGLVKSTGKDGFTIILTRIITDAKDRITGTPVPFDPTHLMEQRGGKQPQ